MKIFEINNINRVDNSTFKAKKMPKQAMTSMSEHSAKLLNVAAASIGMAGLALNMGTISEKHPKKEHIKAIDKIDRDFFMQVYNSKGTIDEKSKKLKISHTTYRRILDELGLEFKPQAAGPKPAYNISKDKFEKVFYSNLSTEEKVKELGLSSPKLYYYYANKLGLKKQKFKNIDPEKFKDVFYSDLSTPEKYEKLGMNASTYYMIAKKHNCITNNRRVKSITKEKFEEVYNKDIPQIEKYKMLGIGRGTYIALAEKFGFPVEIKPATYIRSKDIPVEEFVEIYNQNITVAEKCEKLGISRQTYIKRAKELGLKPRKTFQTDTDLNKISLEDFLKVYNDKSLSINQKCLKLGIGEYSYYKLVRKWSLQKKK